MAAGTPPTVTATACVGFGRLEIAVPDAGAAPVETGGDSAPAPVTYSVTICPLAPLVLGTGALLGFVNIPGAAAATLKDCDAVCPLLFMARTAVAPAAISNGS